MSTTNPNGGALSTVGALGVSVDDYLGFDIFTDAAGVNMAFASLRVAGLQGLYAVNLSTGAALLIGGIGSDRLNGLAVAPVSEPGTMVLSAVAGLALLMRRRNAVPRSASLA